MTAEAGRRHFPVPAHGDEWHNRRNRHCSNCRWFEPCAVDFGACCESPPQWIQKEDEPGWYYPIVGPSDYCSRWTTLEDTPS